MPISGVPARIIYPTTQSETSTHDFISKPKDQALRNHSNESPKHAFAAGYSKVPVPLFKEARRHRTETESHKVRKLFEILGGCECFLPDSHTVDVPGLGSVKIHVIASGVGQNVGDQGVGNEGTVVDGVVHSAGGYAVA